MKKLALVIASTLCICTAHSAYTQTRKDFPRAFQQKEKPLTTEAKGTFDVKLDPQKPDGKFEDATLGRMTIDKQWHGDLEGSSKGTMLTGMSAVKGSAGYVAIERVTGTLQGRGGSFIFQHSGTMTRGTPGLLISVVPDSGTGQLEGITGKLTINITADGKHSYVFDYALPKTP
jgi:hypothetical protein